MGVLPGGGWLRCSGAEHGGEALQEVRGQDCWVGCHEDVEVTREMAGLG